MAVDLSARVPLRRTAGLVTRRHGDETLVLDTLTDTAHHLPAEVARVWEACTAERSLADVATAAGVDVAVADAAVSELVAKNLVEVPAGLDRRRFLKRTVLAGAGVATLPLIQSVVAPVVTAAASNALSASITPTSGPKGQSVTVTGAGFFPNAAFTVTFNGTLVQSGTTDASGNINTAFTVPNDAPGTYNVVIATGTRSVTKTFTINPATLTLKNSGGTTVTSGPKQTLTVTGTGYKPGGTVTIQFDGATVATTTADGSGNISTSFTVPSGATVASHTVTAADTPGNTASASYTVVAPTVTINPPSFPKHTGGGNGSQTFTFTGSGFAPSSAITVAVVDGLTAITGGPTSSTAAGTVTSSATYTATYPNGGFTGHISFTDTFGNTVTVPVTVA